METSLTISNEVEYYSLPNFEEDEVDELTLSLIKKINCEIGSPQTEETDGRDLHFYAKNTVLSLSEKKGSLEVLKVLDTCTKNQRKAIFSRCFQEEASPDIVKILALYLWSISKNLDGFKYYFKENLKTITGKSILPQESTEKIEVALRILFHASKVLTSNGLFKWYQVVLNTHIVMGRIFCTVISLPNEFKILLHNVVLENELLTLQNVDTDIERLVGEFKNQSHFSAILGDLIDVFESLIRKDKQILDIYRKLSYLYDWERILYLHKFNAIIFSKTYETESKIDYRLDFPILAFNHLLKDRSIPYIPDNDTPVSRDLQRYTKELNYSYPGIPLSFKVLNESSLSQKIMILSITQASTDPIRMFSDILELLSAFASEDYLHLLSTFDLVEKEDNAKDYIWIFDGISPNVRQSYILNLLSQTQNLSSKKIKLIEHHLIHLFYSKEVHQLVYLERERVDLLEKNDSLIELANAYLPFLFWKDKLEKGESNDGIDEFRKLSYLWDQNLKLKDTIILQNLLSADSLTLKLALDLFNDFQKKLANTTLNLDVINFFIESQSSIHPELLNDSEIFNGVKNIDKLLHVKNLILNTGGSTIFRNFKQVILSTHPQQRFDALLPLIFLSFEQVNAGFILLGAKFYGTKINPFYQNIVLLIPPKFRYEIMEATLLHNEEDVIRRISNLTAEMVFYWKSILEGNFDKKISSSFALKIFLIASQLGLNTKSPLFRLVLEKMNVENLSHEFYFFNDLQEKNSQLSHSISYRNGFNHVENEDKYENPIFLKFIRYGGDLQWDIKNIRTMQERIKPRIPNLTIFSPFHDLELLFITSLSSLDFIENFLNRLEKVIPRLKICSFLKPSEEEIHFELFQLHSVIQDIQLAEGEVRDQKFNKLIQFMESPEELIYSKLDELFWEIANPALMAQSTFALNSTDLARNFVAFCVQKTMHNTFRKDKFLMTYISNNDGERNKEDLALSLKNQLSLQTGLWHQIPLPSQGNNFWPYIKYPSEYSTEQLVSNYFAHLKIIEIIDCIVYYSLQGCRNKQFLKSIGELMKNGSLPGKRHLYSRDDNGFIVQLSFHGVLNLLLSTGYLKHKSCYNFALQ